MIRADEYVYINRSPPSMNTPSDVKLRTRTQTHAWNIITIDTIQQQNCSEIIWKVERNTAVSAYT